MRIDFSVNFISPRLAYFNRFQKNQRWFFSLLTLLPVATIDKLIGIFKKLADL